MRSAAGRLLMRALGAATFLSLVIGAAQPLWSTWRDTIRLQPLGYHERRIRELGAFYSSLTQLRSQVPPDEPLALITAGPNIDAALFANFYLYPQPLRIYPGRNAYRNAAADPSRPRELVAVGDLVERSSYADLRDRELRSTPKVSRNVILSEPRRQFSIPIAASIDGPEPDTYVIEAVLQNRGNTAADVEMLFFPSGRSARITVAPRSSSAWYDLVYQQFGVMETGWLQVQSSKPLSGAFHFVNRGRSDEVALPVDLHPGSPAQIVAGRDTKVWLLNLRDAPVRALVGDAVIALKPHGLIVRPQLGPVPAIEAAGVYAFVSTRDAAGHTRFFWPR